MKKIIALGVVIFVLVAGYSAAWFWAAGQATAYVKTLETADGDIDAARRLRRSAHWRLSVRLRCHLHRCDDRERRCHGDG